jgi:hypothetical protein
MYITLKNHTSFKCLYLTLSLQKPQLEINGETENDDWERVHLGDQASPWCSKLARQIYPESSTVKNDLIVVHASRSHASLFNMGER